MAREYVKKDNMLSKEIRYKKTEKGMMITEYYGNDSYVVLPVLREKDQLKMGEEQFIPFENDHWVTNYFDGMR